eukprot:10837476-Ditylum_brightwellii.AAC.1
MCGTYSKNKRHDGLMRFTPRANRPLIQCEEVDDKLMQHYQNKSKGDDGLMQHASRASLPLI